MKSSEILEVLQEVSSSFFQALEQRQLVSRILNAAIQLTQGDRGSVFLSFKEPRSGQVKLRSLIATGVGGKELVVDSDQGIVGHVFNSGKPLLIDDVRADKRFYRGVDQKTQYQTRSVLTVPIRTPKGDVLGVIQILNSARGKFLEEDQHVIEILALLSAVALENRQRVESLKEDKEKLIHERRTHLQDAERFVLKSEHLGLQDFYEKLPDFAQSDSSILIEGESGTGKEVIAQVVHLNSKRRDRPFIAINCAAIPESLFEAELFGVAKGAATGTVARKGKIELADGGTLFLDEIGELPLSVQAKLLRVLQERYIQRVGSEEQPKPVDFRVLAATNRDLGEMVTLGKFREDLFYRVNVIQVQLPPLRERRGDIAELCNTILNRFEKERGWKAKSLSESALQNIFSYAWPGNIRQLQNKLEGACIASGDRIVLEPRDLQLDTVSVQEISVPAAELSMVEEVVENFDLRKAKEEAEWEVIQRALQKTKGNKTQAARLLGITREGLRKALLKRGSRELSKEVA